MAHITLLCDLEGELPLSGPKYPQLHTKASGFFNGDSEIRFDSSLEGHSRLLES